MQVSTNKDILFKLLPLFRLATVGVLGGLYSRILAATVKLQERLFKPERKKVITMLFVCQITNGVLKSGYGKK
jgi:hypothetical protein